MKVHSFRFQTRPRATRNARQGSVFPFVSLRRGSFVSPGYAINSGGRHRRCAQKRWGRRSAGGTTKTVAPFFTPKRGKYADDERPTPPPFACVAGPLASHSPPITAMEFLDKLDRRPSVTAPAARVRAAGRDLSHPQSGAVGEGVRRRRLGARARITRLVCLRLFIYLRGARLLCARGEACEPGVSAFPAVSSSYGSPSASNLGGIALQSSSRLTSTLFAS